MEYIIIGVSCTVCTIGIERLNYVICNRDNCRYIYPGWGSDEKLKLTTKLAVEATVFSDLCKNYIIKILENQINF
jgi:hypothetical protein